MRKACEAYISGYRGSSANSQASPKSMLKQMATCTRPFASKTALQCGIDPAPLYLASVDYVGPRHPDALGEVVYHVKDRRVFLEIDDLVAGQHAADHGHEIGPLRLPVEIVDHQETTAREVLAQTRGLRVAHQHIPGSDSVKKGPVVNFIAVDIDDLLH